MRVLVRNRRAGPSRTGHLGTRDQQRRRRDEQEEPYSPFPSTKQPKKRWIVGVSVALLLILIIVVSTLIGVYMTQKHTETMMTMVLSSQDGHNSQQTILVNEQEDVAVFIVHNNSYSSTVLFDYKRRIIGMRTSNSTKCYLLRMDEVQTPSIPDILKTIRNFQSNNAPPNNTVTYDITPIKEANLDQLGMNINILCSDVPIYWSKMVNLQQRKPHGHIEFHIHIGPIHIDGTVRW